MKIYPDKDKAFPNPAIPSLCYIKNVVKNLRIIIGDYTYYDDIDGAYRFEEHVTHFYEFIGDRLIIGNFCAITKGVTFIMNGANHRMDCATTYPFYIMGGDWGGAIAPVMDELPLKGDTIIGNDVWIGQNVTIMPGVHDRRRSHNRHKCHGRLPHSALFDSCRQSGKSHPSQI